MMFLTHILFGFIFSYISCTLLQCNNQVLFITTGTAASILPDLDHLHSKIGRKLQPFSVILNYLFHHRGFVHSIFPPLLLYLLLVSIDSLIAMAIFIGYASHLLLDALTVSGIRPFHPILKFKLKGFVRANGISEKLVTVLFVFIMILVLLQKF